MEQDIKKKSSKINLKINLGLDKLKELPWIIGRRAFPVILMLILLDLILAGFLSYKYIILEKSKTFEESGVSLRFNEDNYKKILNKWESRSQKLQESLKQEYIDPF